MSTRIVVAISAAILSCVGGCSDAPDLLLTTQLRPYEIESRKPQHKSTWIGDYVIENAEDVAGLSGYQSVEGSLIVSRAVLTDLTGLERLKSIEGNLEIMWSTVSTLAGLEGLQEIGGDLSVSGTIRTFSGLDKLKTIGGSIRLHTAYGLESLEGLERLRTIGGSLSVGPRCSDLRSLDGLSSLKYIGGALSVSYGGQYPEEMHDSLRKLKEVGGYVFISSHVEPSLPDISLDKVKSIGGLGIYLYGTETIVKFGKLKQMGSLAIEENRYLASFREMGLQGITSLDAGLSINRTKKLRNFEGLEGLSSIGQGLSIWLTQDLTSLSGLDNVGHIDGDLYLAANQDLESLEGLDSLCSVEGNLRIEHNPRLASLAALNTLESVGGSKIVIRDNGSLPTSEALDLADRLVESGFTGNLIIEGNL